MLVELREKQIFLINLENMDIADVMFAQEDRDEDYDEKLEENKTEYKLSMLEFLDHQKYKKITGYFLGPVHVTIKSVSEQIGGIIDKNYGFKFMITIEDR